MSSLVMGFPEVPALRGCRNLVLLLALAALVRGQPALMTPTLLHPWTRTLDETSPTYLCRSGGASPATGATSRRGPLRFGCAGRVEAASSTTAGRLCGAR